MSKIERQPDRVERDADTAPALSAEERELLAPPGVINPRTRYNIPKGTRHSFA